MTDIRYKKKFLPEMNWKENQKSPTQNMYRQTVCMNLAWWSSEDWNIVRIKLVGQCAWIFGFLFKWRVFDTYV